ncbi:DUF2703 domain-containing protein [Ammoniphilus sp. CFH 90114]|uniref:DUF2703 domain-containing protein n=1 Tax=Ammoniphilus sp. CFH 90114 TaxID=2493665 RepID=UPI00100DB8CB|nr:DUF2703 domain-containing protein [Ammoniphilus sp. CFH 90114]RXT03892.1 DUF2703 domain-containing protein [Ammoniphilus sp. CFH 90114]
MSSCQMNKTKGSDSCGCGSEEKVAQQKESKQLTIDFMYIDLDVCTRCKGTEENLDQVMTEVVSLLTTTGYDVKVNSILIENEKQAEALKFVSSPSIRINGKDIDLTTKESSCDSCGSITGTNVDCRVWVYEGNEYTEAPKALIMNAILKEVYGAKESQNNEVKDSYVVPDNLKKFFAAKYKKSTQVKSVSCNGTEKLIGCC